MLKGCDMIVNLKDLPQYTLDDRFKMKSAFPGEKETIMKFIEENFPGNWKYEAEYAILQPGRKCFIVTENGEIIGFACYDASAKGFFGPIGVKKEKRKEGIGKALLLQTLQTMREDGYWYAIIGWVDDAEHFYRKTVQAEFIAGGNPENSVYSNLVFMK